MAPHDDFESSTQAFLAWLSEIGVKVSPKLSLVDMRSHGRGRGVGEFLFLAHYLLADYVLEGRLFREGVSTSVLTGLVASGDFQEDEVVFSIPRSAVLNVQTTSDKQVTPSSDDSLPPWLKLTSILIAEAQRNDSRWAPYLAVLPQQLHSLIFWFDEELAELQASPVIKRIGKANAEAMFVKHLAPVYGADTAMFHKVASIIMAYAFDIPEEPSAKEEVGGEDDLVSDDGTDEKTILSMIPLADMLNADAEKQNVRLCCDSEDLEMRTIKPISTGEEILNDYGLLPQSDLLRRYGYTTQNYAGFDVAELSSKSILDALRTQPGIRLPDQRVVLLRQDQLRERVELAEREGVYEESYDICHSAQDEPSIPNELLAFLYLLLLDEENAMAILKSQASLPSRSKLETELVGQVLAVLLDHKKSEYGTTIEEDQAILDNTRELPYRVNMAVQVRLGEKIVLRNASREASTMCGSNKRMILNASENSEQNGKRKAHDTPNPGKRTRII